MSLDVRTPNARAPLVSRYCANHWDGTLVVCPRDDLTDLPARGARVTRRGEGAYRQYSTEEQRRQAGCPAREVSRHFVDTPLEAVSQAELHLTRVLRAENASEVG